MVAEDQDDLARAFSSPTSFFATLCPALHASHTGFSPVRCIHDTTLFLISRYCTARIVMYLFSSSDVVMWSAPSFFKSQLKHQSLEKSFLFPKARWGPSVVIFRRVLYFYFTTHITPQSYGQYMCSLQDLISTDSETISILLVSLSATCVLVPFVYLILYMFLNEASE